MIAIVKMVIVVVKMVIVVVTMTMIVVMVRKGVGVLAVLLTHHRV